MVVARVAAVDWQQRHALIVDDVDRDIQVAPEIEQPGPRMALRPLSGDRTLSWVADCAQGIRVDAFSPRRQRNLHDEHHPGGRIPGLRSLWADLLNEGPVPGGLTDEELIAVRERFLAGPDANLEDEHENSLRTWRAAIDRHESYDEVILWFEHDLFDQLNLIQLLTWIRGACRPRRPSASCRIGSFPGRPAFKGLGELAPDELAPLVETRRPVSEAQYALAARLERLPRRGSGRPGPAVAQRSRRRCRFSRPRSAGSWRNTPGRKMGCRAASAGFSSWPIRGRPISSPRFLACSRAREAYFITDGSIIVARRNVLPHAAAAADLRCRVRPRPIRSFRGAASDPERRPRRALPGVWTGSRHCGLDRWYGGVHLEGNGPMWRWDDQAERIRNA